MDKQTFADQILAMEPTLYGIARTFFSSAHDCADAVQEAVLKAWKGRASLKNPAYFKTWVVRILINQCKTMYRQRARWVPMETVPETEPAELPDTALRDAVMALPLPHRLPFVLHYVEGYAVQEIAALLRLPRGTVLSRLHRARQLLKKACGEEAYRYET